MRDWLQLRVQDDEIISEIEMTTDLMIVASHTPGPLCQHTIDAVLGLPAGEAPLEQTCTCEAGVRYDPMDPDGAALG